VRERSDLRRHRYSRVLKRRILIVGEGAQSEPNYFGGLRTQDRVRDWCALTVEAGPGFNPLAIVEHAARKRDSKRDTFDETLCVLDVEEASKAESLRAAKVLASREEIALVLSNPCFEVWLLSHFVRSHRAYLNAAQVEEVLSVHWQQQFGYAYSKKDPRVFNRLLPHLPVAVENAAACRSFHEHGEQIELCNSSTAIDTLVRRLMKM
jgi:hypothetical protein